VAGAITTAKITAGAITADTIAANAVNADKIAANAITAGKIAANTITATNIAANTITSSLIAANTITATNIASGAITAGAIAAGAVTADKITADAIDGKTVTGATIQTSSGTGARVVMDTAGLRGFNASNQERVNINASTGNITITGGTVSSGFISGGTISGGFITGGTIEGASLRTASSGARVQTGSAFGVLSSVEFFTAFGSNGFIGTGLNAAELLLAPGSGGTVTINGPTSLVGNITADAALKVAGANVDMIGVFNNNTTGIDEVGIVSGTGRLRRISSSQAIKYDVTPITGTLSPSVDSDRVSDVVTVDPLAVLDVAVTEFSVIDDGEPTDRRVLGFIAEDVADKLPVAVSRDADGQPLGVLNTSLVAALLAVGQQQQATITDLRTRIEALEA
jgi:hypothetical protein